MLEIRGSAGEGPVATPVGDESVCRLSPAKQMCWVCRWRTDLNSRTGLPVNRVGIGSTSKLLRGSATAMQRPQRRLATLDRWGTRQRGAVRSPSARSPAIADTYVHRRAPSYRPLCNAFIDHHRPVDAVRVSEGKPPMENAKHIGCMWALAVAVGVGMAVANTPGSGVGRAGRFRHGFVVWRVVAVEFVAAFRLDVL